MGRSLDSYLRDRRQSESNIVIEAAGRSSCSQEIDDALDGGIGAVIGGFEPAVWTVLRVRPVMEAAVGEGAAQALVEEEDELDPTLGREPVGVARAVALDQAVSLELAQVVAELVQTVGVLREVEGVEDGLMDLPGGWLGIVHWANPEGADTFTILSHALKQLPLPTGLPDAPKLTALMSAHELRAALEARRCEVNEVERLDAPSPLLPPESFMDTLDPIYSSFPTYRLLDDTIRGELRVLLAREARRWVEEDVPAGRTANVQLALARRSGRPL